MATEYLRIANAQFGLSDFAGALKSLECALKIRQALSGENDLSTAECYFSLGATYFMQEKYTRAFPYLQKAYQIYAAHFPASHTMVQGSKNMMETCVLFMK